MDNFFADISSNNAGFSAAPYASAGHPVIMIKATEGLGFTNPDYAPWVADARRHGLAVLHYMFARPDQGEPQQQALRFLETVEPHFHRPGDYLVIDLEQGSPAGIRAFYEPLRDTLRAHHHRPWLYIYLSFLESSNLVADGEPLHIAAYGPRNPGGMFWRLRGYTVAAWQHSDGRVGPPPHTYAGIPGLCDSSVMNPAFARRIRRRHR